MARPPTPIGAGPRLVKAAIHGWITERSSLYHVAEADSERIVADLEKAP